MMRLFVAGVSVIFRCKRSRGRYATSRLGLPRRPPERLNAPVRQAPPQPFERAVQEIAQPKRTDDQLQDPYRQHDEIDLVKLQLRIVVEPVAEEEQGADDRVHDVI